jgi:hypothetical protein
MPKLNASILYCLAPGGGTRFQRNSSITKFGAWIVEAMLINDDFMPFALRNILLAFSTTTAN